MAGMNLMGKRVLITNADVFMGPVLCQVFAEHGATVPSFAQFLHNDHWLGKSESNGETVPPAATFNKCVANEWRSV